MKTVVSWNVNGVRAVAKKGFLEWLKGSAPDILCIQETKAQKDQLTEEITAVDGYHSYWMSAEKKGYSGVGLYSKVSPLQVSPLGIKEFDAEGRTLIADFEAFSVITSYFPNSQPGGARLSYKLGYCTAVEEYCKKLKKTGRNFVLCGDYNISHKPIDLARPKENEESPGYLPEEREWMDGFTQAGFTDTFRMFEHEGGHYTWRSYVTRARERNVGWRLDYHCVPDYYSTRIKASEILSEVMGSDHCPVKLTIEKENG